MDAPDILFMIVIVENKTNDKDPTLAVIITITGTGITTRIGTEMDALLIATPIIETIFTAATISSLGANLEIIIIEAEMIITIALIKTPLIDLLLPIIKVLIILYKIRLRHPLLLLTSRKYCLIINLFEEPWLPTYMWKLKMLILFKLLPILHLSNVMSLFRTNPIRPLLIVVLQSV